MFCGVKFCGGCNPRYDRGKALVRIREELADSGISLENVKEEKAYDRLLIIAGCSACCASFEQYTFEGEPVRVWDVEHIPEAIEILKNSNAVQRNS